MSDQPEALRLADELLAMGIPADVADPAAVLLRAQHEEIERLRARAEPVAWINDDLDIELSHKPWMSDVWKPLYTAPPARRALTPVQEAAPELLEALRVALHLIETISPFFRDDSEFIPYEALLQMAKGDVVRNARAAIAKAEGACHE